MPDRSLYKVGVVLRVENCGGNNPKSNKAPLRACQVNVGDADNPMTVVTSATNVREGSRVAVAPAGSFVANDEGEEIEVKETTVGGVMSRGMLCDSRMLGWTGGAQGIAAQIPEGIELGTAPPATKPRPGGGDGGDGGAAPEEQQQKVEGLYAKKLTKEEKKKLAEEKRKAKKAAKEAKKAAAAEGES